MGEEFDLESIPFATCVEAIVKLKRLENALHHYGFFDFVELTERLV